MSVRDFLSQQKNKKEPHGLLSSHVVKEILIPLGSLLIAAISVLPNYQLVPKWAIYVITFYLTFVLIAVLWAPLRHTVASFMENQRERQRGKSFLPLLQKSAKEFDEFIEWNNTILDWFLKINQWDELKRKIQVNAGYVVTFRDWHSSIKGHFNFYRPKDYQHLANELSILILRYHNFCIEIQCQLERLIYPINDKGMPEPSILSEQHLRLLKEEWSLRRERHMLFINEWKKLVKEINETAGKSICIDYYEQLKTFK